MVWETNPATSSGSLCCGWPGRLIPLAVLWVGKLIVDEVVHAIGVAGAGGPAPWTRLAVLLGIELAIALVGEGLSRVSALLESLLGDLFANRTSVQLMQHAATLDLEQFENAEIYDKLERARRQTVGRIGLFTMLLATLQDLITLISLAAALAVYVPWLLVLLVVAVLPSLLGETHFASLGYSLLYSWTPERRQLDYLRYIGASDISAKELKLFGLSDFLVGRYDRLSEEFYQANKSLAVRRSVVSTPARVGGDAGLLRGLRRHHLSHSHRAPVASRGVHHRRAHLPGRLVPPEPRPDPAGAALAVAGLRAEPLPGRPVQLPRTSSPASGPIRGRRPGAGADPDQGFVFEGVGFRYPGSEHWAVRGLDFSLAPGERIALVGENGAGKTTLVKLLARLYDPTEGRILLDGVDLREYDIDSLRRNVGVIFQDFVRYDFMLKENIAVGNIGRLEDEPAIDEAARAEPGRLGGPAAAGPVRPDAGQAVRGRGGSLGRRVAEGGAGPGLHAGRAAPDPGRAHRGAGCPGGVRGVSPVLASLLKEGWRC